jgi:hypothetical protein
MMITNLIPEQVNYKLILYTSIVDYRANCHRKKYQNCLAELQNLRSLLEWLVSSHMPLPQLLHYCLPGISMPQLILLMH